MEKSQTAARERTPASWAPSRFVELAARLGIGGFLVLLGLSVLVGWHTETVLLIQVHPSFVPMQFNTALGFLSAGLVLCGVRSRRAGVARSGTALAAFVALLGAATLTQYLLDVSFGIDELLMEHHVETLTSHRGRMAPNTATCFTLVGVALLGARRALRTPGGLTALGLVGIVVVALGAVPFAGYLMGVEVAYGWGVYTRMAVHTAASFVLLGVAIVALAWFAQERNPRSLPAWLAAVVGTAALTVTVLIWQAMGQRDVDRARTALAENAETACRELAKGIRDKARALSRMAARARYTTEAEWRQDAIDYLDDFDTMSWVAVLDGEGRVALAAGEVPPDGVFSERAVALMRSGQVVPGRDAFRFLAADGSALLAWPTDYAQGDPVVVAGVEVKRLVLGAAALRSQGATAWSLDTADEVLVRGPEPRLAERIDQAVNVDLPGVSWVLRLSGSPSAPGGALAAVLALGGASSVLLWIAVFFAQTLRRRGAALQREVLQRQHAETALREHMTALDRSNRDLGDFAHVVSHDLKAPLRAIGSLVQWVDADCRSFLDDDGRENLDLLLSRTERLSRLIDGILTYSQAGATESERQRIDVRALVERVGDALRTDDAFEVVSVGSIPDCAYDPTQLEQIFQNLIGNAQRYAFEGGRVEVSGERRRGGVEYAVRDFGPGIAVDHAERIFRMFQTLQPRDRVDSTGVGLAVVKKLVERNGGEIWVDPNVGKGACFRFSVPHAANPASTRVDWATVESESDRA